MKRKTIILDFDQTCYRTWERFLEIAKERYPSTVRFDSPWMIREHGFQPALDMTDELIGEIFSLPEFYESGYFIEGFIDFYKYFTEKGYKIWILTVGNPYNNLHKSLLLERENIQLPLVGVTYGGNGVKFDKSIVSGNGFYFIDDRTSCLDSVEGGFKIRMSYKGMALDEDKRDKKYPVVENMFEAMNLIRSVEELDE